MANFIAGLRLSAEFFQEAVAPILATNFRGVPYSAALIGSGSEVLGFDTEMSSDHHWGPRVMLFLREADHARYHTALHRSLSDQLPRTFHGYPTNFTPPNPEDSGTQLNAKARADLDRVCSAARRMAQLIDDLLDLARIARLPLERREVNLSEIVRNITAELSRNTPNRQVKVIVPDGLVAPADPVLTEMVLQNLLDNAWKFTSKHPTARIEFGTVRGSGESIFFVRDDGVGFDMTYADKLFSPFQRLHRTEEFPGTGIGLATVKRIISRHGGQVWIESELNRGTTVYFTLETVAGFGSTTNPKP